MSADWVATYRLQLHAGFPLAAAGALLPYLAELGISHVYLSPCLQAMPGSQHGYDVTDPTRISDDLGGEAAWQDFRARARDLGLGLLLDIVPNHMAANAHNPWWDDYLAHGPCSRYAAFFDVFPDGGPGPFRVHLATLGRPYGEALAAGELQVELSGGHPRLTGHGQSWPLTPASWRQLLPAESEVDPLLKQLDELRRQPALSEADRTAYEGGVRTLLVAWEKIAADPQLQERVAAINHDPARLHELLEAQWYALHGWKLAGELSNYRRFFDIGGLVGLRVEDESVFAASHERIAALCRDGDVDGLRVDHSDGLRFPGLYFERLRKLLPAGRIYTEKILEVDEHLREEWPVQGTVGYDFLSKVNLLWMDARKSDALSAIYADYTGHTVNLSKVVREKKAVIIAALFGADLERLTDLGMKIARGFWRTRDISRSQLKLAITELTVLLPVYRTYRGADGADREDRAALAGLLRQARSRRPEVAPAVFDYLERLMLDDAAGAAAQEFIARWQQLTPAVTAKGVEDTTFYCYDRLVACNEVGAQASLLGISSEKFHEFCHHLAEHWPETMLATSTHDTKRSEDVRTRICVLTEDIERWGPALAEWTAMNRSAWKGRAADPHAEYLLYQTLVGAWPIDFERAWNYLLKACREAKINTSWREPNAAYEQSLKDFLSGIYASEKFLASLARYLEPLVRPGRINSLAQTLIKLTAPGVPDFYQGTELWDLSLVDPDNRRPVDFELRRTLMARLADLPADGALQDWDLGLPKMWLIRKTLAVRRSHPEWFARGSTYQPVTASGARLGHVLGFIRGGRALTLVPRFTHTLGGDWGDTKVTLPAGDWHHVFSEERFSGDVSPDALFHAFPVALLVQE
ncbi:MAG TPA: malto-oligosyltrehalose synthase [Lacunisphaera sp.]|nr:malto-oligosyltrehalose synthase [Lacunisphaera sp.]